MTVKNIEADELRDLIKNNRDEIEIVDVREPQEADIIRIKNSKLIPMNELQSRINEIDWKKEVIFLCRSGARSKMIADILSKSGKEVTNLKYGIHECYADGKGENLEIDKKNIDRYFG
ncbi:MAG: rhodanese-like domain-containing protein [Nanoarchaeota archaeon]